MVNSEDIENAIIGLIEAVSKQDETIRGLIELISDLQGRLRHLEYRYQEEDYRESEGNW